MLASNIEALENVAREANIIPLTVFADNRAIPDDFEGDPEELNELLGEWDEWFPAVEGAKVAETLAAHIAHDSMADEVLAELEELARVLRIAAVEEVRFRLQLG